MKNSITSQKPRRVEEAPPQVNLRRRTRTVFWMFGVWAVILIVGSLLLGYFAFRSFGPLRANAGVVSLNDEGPISSTSAWDNVRLFLAGEEWVTASLTELKPRVLETISSGVRGHFAFYLEDLRSGKWLGINETDRFNTWSLLKVSVMVSVMRKIQQNQVALDQEVQIRPEDIDSAPVVPSPMNNGGRKVRVKDLIDEMIELSDNTASRTLARLFTAPDFQTGLMGMGLPTNPPDAPPSQLPAVSPKQFANLLRSLYYSGYLKKPFCELALALLSQTIYDSQIKMGVPNRIQVAHKVGFNASCGEFHDCGIVYLPGRPYILCVMSSGSTREESDRVISTVSRQVYEYMAGAGQSLPKP